jgi:hypothetical protein
LTLQPAELRVDWAASIDHVVDFTQPDPASGRQLQDLVDAYLKPTSETVHKLASEELQRTFHLWIATAPKFDTVAATHPLVAEMSVRRSSLSSSASPASRP